MARARTSSRSSTYSLASTRPAVSERTGADRERQNSRYRFKNASSCVRPRQCVVVATKCRPNADLTALARWPTHMQMSHTAMHREEAHRNLARAQEQT